MKRFFGIYRECVKTAFSMAAAYRLNFIVSLVITLVGNLLFPLVTVLIYRSGASFPEWGFYEVLLIQSVFTLSSGLANVLMGATLWVTMQHIRAGTFEVILLKPLDPLFYILATTFEPESFGLILGGGAIFVIAVLNTGIASALAFMQFLLLFLSGFAVTAGIILMMGATSFKWVGNSRIPEIFESVRDLGKYPMSIFPKAVQSLITFIIPVGMVGFFPASALLGRTDMAALAAVPPCLLFLLLGVWLYQHMIRLYEGVGG